MSMFDICSGLQRELEKSIWETAPNKPSARESVRLQRRFLDEAYDRVEGRTAMDGSKVRCYLVPECLAPLSNALKACYSLASQAREGTPEAHLLALHVNCLLSAVTIADERANKTSIGRTLFGYQQWITSLNALKDAGEWVGAVIVELRNIRLDDLDQPLADNTRFLIMNVAAVLFEPTNLLRLHPLLGQNVPRHWLTKESITLSAGDVDLWRDYSKQVADEHSPWLGLALLRALEDLYNIFRTPEGNPVPLPEWLRGDLITMRDSCRGTAGQFRPHTDNTLRIIQIGEDDVRHCDLTNISRGFDRIEAGPHLHRLRGNIAITFSCFDQDPRPNYLIPEVRAFFAALHAARPYFFYFVVPDPKAGLFLLHIFALIPMEKLAVGDDYRTTPNLPPQQMMLFVATHLRPAVRFCKEHGDDVQALLSSIAPNFPAPFWQAIFSLIL